LRDKVKCSKRRIYTLTFDAEFPRYANETPREAEGEGFEQISTNLLTILSVNTPYEMSEMFRGVQHTER